MAARLLGSCLQSVLLLQPRRPGSQGHSCCVKPHAAVGVQSMAKLCVTLLACQTDLHMLPTSLSAAGGVQPQGGGAAAVVRRRSRAAHCTGACPAVSMGETAALSLHCRRGLALAMGGSRTRVCSIMVPSCCDLQAGITLHRKHELPSGVYTTGASFACASSGDGSCSGLPTTCRAPCVSPSSRGRLGG